MHAIDMSIIGHKKTAMKTVMKTVWITCGPNRLFLLTGVIDDAGDFVPHLLAVDHPINEAFFQ